MGNFSPKTTSRAWMVTVQIANMEKLGMPKEEYENPEALAEKLKSLWEDSGKNRKAGVAVCVSEKGLYHVHMACYGNTSTLKKVSTILGDSHVEPQLGGKAELTAYLQKTGKYAEKGEQVLCTLGLETIEDNQGRRSDLEVIEELIEEGLTPSEIFEESFRFRRYERLVRGAYRDKRIKDSPLMKETWNEYHFGSAGTGKTYEFIKLWQEHPDDVYMCNDYSNAGSSGGGLDYYMDCPAKILVLDEFRGNMPYNQLLSMLDVYSRNQSHCRYQNIYNLWTSVVIASVLPPEEVYKRMVDEENRSRDSMQQFMRRLNVIVYHYKNKDGKYRQFKMPACDYVGKDDMIQKAREYEKNADEYERLMATLDVTKCDGTIDVEKIIKDFDAVEVKR